MKINKKDYLEDKALIDLLDETEKILRPFDDKDAFIGVLASHYLTDLFSELHWKYRRGGVIPKIIQANGEFGRNTYALEWFDHHGEIIDHQGNRWATIEPYGGLGMERLEELISFCKERKLTFVISERSPHYPLKTLLIMIRRVY